MHAHFLKKFTLKTPYREIPPFKVEFRPGMNVIVGENGSGKSTLLHLLTSGPDKETKSIVADTAETRFLDTEKMNPRFQSVDGSKNIRFTLSSHFVSHGEAMLPLLKAVTDFHDLVLFVDEPDAGLSLSNQVKVFRTFEKIVKEQGCQIVLTTHSYQIIQNVDEVFSMDTKEWIPSKQYLESVTNG